MPLGMTQFFSTRYHHTEPEPACSSGATVRPESSLSRLGSMRVPAMESPMTTIPGFMPASSPMGVGLNESRTRGPSSAGRYDGVTAVTPCRALAARMANGTVSVSRASAAR